jgi:hypothetical protein
MENDNLKNETATDANTVLAEGVRPFTDLIKEIEFEGKKFIPAQKIAALCFNYNEKAVKNKCQMWVNESYDCRMWYLFQTNILKPKKHQCSIGISRNFDISTYHRIGDEEPKSNVGMPPSNQVDIVKNLMRWGFIAFR